VELADTSALGADAERRRGSNPLLGTLQFQFFLINKNTPLEAGCFENSKVEITLLALAVKRFGQYL
jgi:hypothetical protein